MKVSLALGSDCPYDFTNDSVLHRTAAACSMLCIECAAVVPSTTCNVPPPPPPTPANLTSDRKQPGLHFAAPQHHAIIPQTKQNGQGMQDRASASASRQLRWRKQKLHPHLVPVCARARGCHRNRGGSLHDGGAYPYQDRPGFLEVWTEYLHSFHRYYFTLCCQLNHQNKYACRGTDTSSLAQNPHKPRLYGFNFNCVHFFYRTGLQSEQEEEMSTREPSKGISSNVRTKSFLCTGHGSKTKATSKGCLASAKGRYERSRISRSSGRSGSNALTGTSGSA